MALAGLDPNAQMSSATITRAAAVVYDHAQPTKRQIWASFGSTTPQSIPHCTPFALPSNGVISYQGATISLTGDAIFKPECTGTTLSSISSVAGPYDPFYASTIPQTYVIAAATVIAWILVIMLIITPRTNFLGQSGTVPGFSTGHGIIGGSTGGHTDLIGVGSRPWLQKVAAFTVAVSLTIATADTFKFAQRQYATGYMDATELRYEVLGSLEIRIMRVITDVFLWLAQVQTLIRLFPRHKEKVLIKWIGFALILFDSIFSCLNSFLIYYKDQRAPHQFRDAVPALSYLFEFAVGLLYAAWVMYYSVTKRRYAFYHSKMPSISLIALLSLIAVLTPVVFFVTDVSNSDIAGWGDYFRWVGAAAASVVVWEWVERIEALERDEKKDGILGREIFDGDEMLDVWPSDEIVWTRSRYDRNRYRRNGSDDTPPHSSALERGFNRAAQHFRPRIRRPMLRTMSSGVANSHSPAPTTENEAPTHRSEKITFGVLPRPRANARNSVASDVLPPGRIISPISRTDTTSAASTVYVVQNNLASEVPQPVRRRIDSGGDTEQDEIQSDEQAELSDSTPSTATSRDPEKEAAEATDTEVNPNQQRNTTSWLPVSNPFKRKRASPPAEVQQARQTLARNAEKTETPTHNFSRWDIKNRIGVLAAETGDKWRDRRHGKHMSIDVPVMVIPAQPRGSGNAWKPPETSHGHVGPQTTIATSTATTTNARVERHEGVTDLGRSATPASTNGGDNHIVTAQRASPSLHSPVSTSLRTDPASRTPTPNRRSTASPSEPGRSPPPRASDLRPMTGSTSPVIVPAPRRVMASSPLAVRVASESGSSSAGSSSRSGTRQSHG